MTAPKRVQVLGGIGTTVSSWVTNMGSTDPISPETEMFSISVSPTHLSDITTLLAENDALRSRVSTLEELILELSKQMGVAPKVFAEPT